ncbi:FHA domain-containing protein [Streptomyces sp. SDr-06]|uniref:FtsK/SpoIIIE domain-containing protein n=1 Tax=Streptomyces sp. SDr-06 TaxID=2267702 RepID=UPI000DE8AD72|nr:FtsK/SpoIIIE domain-containing protein [Streptomyces sp. SDr-06]RCH68321.1 FHA domain-containing protein [Streptomyces sp. SDr-06]
MQIRLTVLAPRSGHAVARACDVLVTAPAGTALAAVASGLASAASGAEVSGASVVLFAGRERLDAQRRVLGEPPLVDGAVLSLGAPAEDEPAHDGPAPARLHVVAGPDAGGVHLLHGGRIGIGRSTESDVPLDDPDVSRRHCEVTVGEDGRVSVADLNSTNGTRVDGREIGAQPVRFAPGALLRIGESALRLSAGGPEPEPSLTTVPDGEGHLRVTPASSPACAAGGEQPGPAPRLSPPTGETAYSFGSSPSALAPLEPGAHEGAYGAGIDALGAPSGYGHDGRDDHREPAHPSRRQGTPTRGTRLPEGPLTGPEDVEHARADAPDGGRRRGGIGAWARRLTGGRGEPVPERAPAEPQRAPAEPAPESWPDPAALLLTALGPGPRLWEREPGHPEALAVRVGTADRGELAAVPVTVGLREVGSLGLAGPRDRLAGLARSGIAQLAALHAPTTLEIVLISTDRARGLQARTAEWDWLGWLPQVRPAHGQDCRLLLAYDRDQATARTAELVRRLDAGPLGPGWASADRAAVTEAAARYEGPFTVVVVDGDPGSAPLRETTARLAAAGAAAGIHLLCLAEAPPASAASPVAATYETACAASLAFRECGAVALLSGDVATALRLLRTAGGRPAGHGTVAAVDAVSRAWAERFARALAPLRTGDGTAASTGRLASSLPRSSRLLDELGLARATPASLMARWESASDGAAVLGTGPHGPVGVDLASEGPHLLVEGPTGSGRTELLRAVAASLAAGARPDRLGLILVDGAGGERGEGLRPCTELPHVSTHLIASDPVRMREFAQALGAELKRRAEVLGGLGFAEWQTRREVAGRLVGQRQAPAAESRGDLDPPGSSTLRLRPVARSRTEEGPSLPRLVVLVDDLDALVAPALGSPGRPAAGSVVRALEAVAREGERLGVHLVASSARPDRTADTELARGARHRVVLDAPPASPSPDDPSPGRGRLHQPDGASVPFQGGRVTGRIPRTATQRPTVVVLEWERMGDPPARRPVRELGNGPTDLALLASALDRAASLVNAPPVPPLS